MSKEITKWKRNCPKCGETVYHANERMLKRAIHENRPCRECSNPDRGKIKRDELRDKHYNPKTDRWFNECPSCLETLYYTDRHCLKRAVDEEYICWNCSLEKRKTEYRDSIKDLVIYEPEDKVWFRSCPICRSEMDYDNYHGYRQGERLNSPCRTCSMEQYHASEEGQVNQKRRSMRISKLWADPTSAFNTPEYRQGQVESGKLLYQSYIDNQSGLCDPEVREAHRVMVIEPMNDPC